jgi:hypothetical protein
VQEAQGINFQLAHISEVFGLGRRLFQIGTAFSHVPSGTTTNDPLVSEFHSSVSALFFPRFNLFGKKVEAQRTGRLVKVYILAFELIALHKQLVF